MVFQRQNYLPNTCTLCFFQVDTYSWMRLQTSYAIQTATHITSAVFCCTCLLKPTQRPFKNRSQGTCEWSPKMKFPCLPETFLICNARIVILIYLLIAEFLTCGVIYFFWQGFAGAIDCKQASSMGTSHHFHWAHQESSIQVLDARVRPLRPWDRKVSGWNKFTISMLTEIWNKHVSV